MKKLTAALSIALIICVLASCAKDDPAVDMSPAPSLPPTQTPIITETPAPAESPVDTPEPGKIAEITDLVHIETVDVSEGYVLNIAGWYPQTGVAAIDKYYTNQCEDFIGKAFLLGEELLSYDDTSSAISQYFFDDNYEIVKNSDDIFSVHRTIYKYIGGAHGNHTDMCDNFRISDGARLTLDDIFDCTQDEYVTDICNIFDAFIDADSAGYYFFNDAKTALRDDFPIGKFCITDTGLSFYISPYAIAPYSSGTIVIPVAWEDLTVPRKDI